MKRVWWHLSDYISHRRAGEAYRRCLPLAGFEAVDRPEDAELAVLHDDPMNWLDILARYPTVRTMPKIGFAVWEGLALPDVYRAGFALVDEIWTASEFSAQALRQGHGRVKVLPHVVEPAGFSSEEQEWARARLGLRPEERYFFSIVDAVNPRKNLDALLRVFARLAHSSPDISLVLKQYRMNLSFGEGRQVVSIGENVSEGRLAALHAGALAYVSPHRGEAWGLGLSEAMSHGVPVLATGWSGNMEFMDQRNSVPLRYALEPVGERMSRMLPHFRPEMVWARIDEEHLLREMLRLVRRGQDPDMCQRARAVAERFSSRRVSRILAGLVREFEDSFSNPA